MPDPNTPTPPSSRSRWNSEPLEDDVAENTTTQYFWGTGRRKTSVARVRIRDGEGQILVNKKTLHDYFPTRRHQLVAIAPLIATELLGKVDVFANIKGGGVTGHAGAFSHGVARALCKMDPSLAPILRKKGFLTRDPRVVERKKYGRHKARRSTQFSKR